MKADNWNRHFRDFKRKSGPTLRADPDLMLAAFLSDRASRLLRQPHYGRHPGRAPGKRVTRSLRSAFLMRRFPISPSRRQILQKPAALLFKVSSDMLRDGIYPPFLRTFKPVRDRLRQRVSTDVDLENFSFAKDPVGTMAKLSRITEVCASKGDVRLNFLDDCDDVTPYVVLSLLRPSLPPVISGGQITMSVRDVIDAVGMRDVLRIGSPGRAGRSKARGAGYSVSAFPLTKRTPPGTFGDKDHQLRPQFKEVVGDRFVDTINAWLSAHELELVPEAAARFISAITEALDNAERHGDALEGDAEGDWSIAAFSKQITSDGRKLRRCSIGIVSVGATIAQSLTSAADPITSWIDRYAKAHASPLQRRRTQALHTVTALQDGITRDRVAEANRRGGVGFMELIEAIAELGDNGLEDQPSSFTIVSGSSCLRLTGQYRQGRRKNGALRELWFNDENDPTKAPSKDHVMTLDHEFPGVVLSACFTIDPEHLRKKLSDGASDA